MAPPQPTAGRVASGQPQPPSLPSSQQDDSISIMSSSTTVTMESFQALENKLTGLASQMKYEQEKNGQQFNAIMSALQNLNNVSMNDHSANSNQRNARDDTNSSGKGS